MTYNQQFLLFISGYNDYRKNKKGGIILGLELLPDSIRERYEVHEVRHACAILKQEFPEEWDNILEVLENFQLFEEYITEPGGRKSAVSEAIDSHFYRLNWMEKSFDTRYLVDGKEMDTPTHSIDCFKNRVGVEIEWNNKDPFYDRDLNNFRLLFELKTLDVGVIITRCTELQQVFKALGKGQSYGASTTHMGKLLPKLDGGGAGGCPVLIFGISPQMVVYKDRQA